MPTETRIDKLTPDEREAHIKATLEKKRHQRGTADDSLRVLGTVTDVPLAARDELKALRGELRDVREHAEDRIEELRDRLKALRADQKPDAGATAAVKFALSQAGITETPAGSNWGHPVQDWIQRTGYSSNLPHPPWCGCYVHECVVEHGGAAIPVGIRLGYGPAIIADARANANGLRAVPFAEAQPGDILVFWNGEHIGLCRGRPSGSTIPTAEGNTSPGTEGSQYNGGCVAIKSRSIGDVTVVARPNYPN